MKKILIILILFMAVGCNQIKNDNRISNENINENESGEKMNDVKVENGYAIFETDHFSTYVLNAVKNPNTSDMVLKYIILFTISLIGIIGSCMYLKTNYNKN